MCDASSMQVALDLFVGDFAKITELARDLPRSSNVRDLADKLIKAAEDDEDALRELMRKWQPDAQELFEMVNVQQSNSTAVQQEVEDALADLKEEASAASRDLLDSFSETLSSLNEDWDTFHRDYDTFRSEQRKLIASERAVRLSKLVAQFGELGMQVRNLPKAQLIRPVTDILVEAAEQEDLALRKLRDAFEQEQGGSAESAPPPGEFGAGGAVAAPKSVFEDFDTQLVQSNTCRHDATEKLADIVKDSSIESEQAVEEFSRSYGELHLVWKAFHQEYDTWRVESPEVV